MITIRKASPADTHAIWQVRTSAIEQSCGSHYTQEDVDRWSSFPMPDDFEDLIATRDFLVAEADDSIVGCGFLTHELSQIDAVFVSPDYQRRGAGRQLLAALEMIARDAGLKSLRLSSTLNAVEFYKSLGFEAQSSGRYSFSFGLVLDCVRMEKSLDHTRDV